MKTKEKEILKLLQEGKSYSDIQVALSVSPTTIIVVKKKFLNTIVAHTSTPNTTIKPIIQETPINTIDTLLNTTTTIKNGTLEKQIIEEKFEIYSKRRNSLHKYRDIEVLPSDTEKIKSLVASGYEKKETITKINNTLEKQIADEKIEIYSKRRHGLHKYPHIEVLSSDTKKIKSLTSDGYEKKEAINKINDALEKKIVEEKTEIYSKRRHGLHKYRDIEVLASDTEKIKLLIADGYEKK